MIALCGFGLPGEYQILQCGIFWCPDPARLECSCILSKLSVIYTPCSNCLLYSIYLGNDEESLVSYEISCAFWLLLAPHSKVNCEAYHPLQYVCNWCFLVRNCLRLFFTVIYTEPFRQQVGYFSKYSTIVFTNQFSRDWGKSCYQTFCCGIRWGEWHFCDWLVSGHGVFSYYTDVVQQALWGHNDKRNKSWGVLYICGKEW